MLNQFLQRLLDAMTPEAVVSGRKTVTTGGTPETLVAATTPCKYVIITAEEDNTGDVVVGASNVDATLASRTGILLEPSRSEKIYISDAVKLFLDVETNGDGVTYAIFK